MIPKPLRMKIAGRALGRPVPRGVDIFHDVARFFAGAVAPIAFDVGANKGQSAMVLKAAFPDTALHCFEPGAEAFAALTEATRGFSGVTLHQMALGAEAGTAVLEKSAASDLRRVAAGSDGAADGDRIPLSTVDAMAATLSLERIGYLKIDTEGHDLEVLKGAAGMLARDAVDCIQVEAGMNSDNTLHVPMETLKGHLEGAGYRLIGVYEQVGEWPSGRINLRRSDLLFASRTLIERVARPR